MFYALLASSLDLLRVRIGKPVNGTNLELYKGSIIIQTSFSKIYIKSDQTSML
jgi:hypothetical protein